jgi:predicted nucleotidyltransferase
MSITQKLTKEGLIKPPRFLPDSVQYETITGSFAYRVSSDDSDLDVYGFCIPEKKDVFPHLRGEIVGFGRQIQRFEQYQQHHVFYKEKEYDLTIYSIVKYFQLCMENNPNIIDSLFTPQHTILHCSPIAQMVRDKRKIFLHKGAWYKFKGYAYSQIHKMKLKEPFKDQNLIDTLKRFENDNNIPNSTSIEDIRKEMNKRKLIPSRLRTV